MLINFVDPTNAANHYTTPPTWWSVVTRSSAFHTLNTSQREIDRSVSLLCVVSGLDWSGIALRTHRVYADCVHQVLYLT